MSCFFCTNLLGQEVVNKDTIGHNTTIKTSSDKGFISFDRETSVIKNVKVSGSQNYDSATVLDINTESPFYIPAYHINSSPMFYGDYSSCRQLFPNLYGSGSQTTIPGIGRVNQVSIFYQRQLNAFFDINAGINAVKFNLPYSLGQSFGMFGSLTYHPNEVFRIKIFGACNAASTSASKSKKKLVHHKVTRWNVSVTVSILLCEMMDFLLTREARFPKKAKQSM